LSAIKSEANAPNNQNGLLRNKTKTVFGVPMVLLVIAASGQLGVAKPYWVKGIGPVKRGPLTVNHGTIK
jgi:hypothetical protein